MVMFLLIAHILLELGNTNHFSTLLLYILLNIKSETLFYIHFVSEIFVIFYNYVVRKKKELMNKIFTTSTAG